MLIEITKDNLPKTKNQLKNMIIDAIKKPAFQTHNDIKISINGTCLQGYITCPFEKLVETFGNPMTGDFDKTDAEWNITFDDGTIATIYNWKNGKNYCGDEGQEIAEITDWNIGGNSKNACAEVYSAVFQQPYGIGME